MNTYEHIEKMIVETVNNTATKLDLQGKLIKIQNVSGKLYYLLPECVKYVVTTNVTGNNNDLVYTVNEYGKTMYVEYIAPDAANAELSYVINGDKLTINLATDEDKAVTTTAGDIITLLTDENAISVDNAGTDDGTGVVAAMSAVEAKPELTSSNGFEILTTQEPIELFIKSELHLLSDSSTATCQIMVFSKQNH